jgi:hypothetical protein
MVTLTASDRCDRCGARAAVRYSFLSGDLFMCAHHDRLHGAALRAAAVVVHDEPEAAPV